MRAIQVTELGGPEVLRLTELPDPHVSHVSQALQVQEVPEGMVPIQVHAAGVNFADTMQTAGEYVEPTVLPYVPGAEVVGTTPDGRRVVALAAGGGYLEHAIAPAFLTVDLPDGVGDAQALALLVQGLTAWHLVHTSARVRPGESVVVHAAAGGVGSLAVQLARQAGARVVATAGSHDKRELAAGLGAHASVDARLPREQLAQALVEANEGRPVDVVLDAVGGEVFAASLAALAPFGRLVSYGAAGGRPAPVEPFDLTVGSKGVLGFYLRDVFALPDGLAGPLGELIARTADGRLRHLPAHTYPLEDAARAHADLLARRTTGKVVLATGLGDVAGGR